MISIEMEKEIVYIKGKRLKAEVSEREKSRKGAKMHGRRHATQ